MCGYEIVHVLTTAPTSTDRASHETHRKGLLFSAWARKALEASPPPGDFPWGSVAGEGMSRRVRTACGFSFFVYFPGRDPADLTCGPVTCARVPARRNGRDVSQSVPWCPRCFLGRGDDRLGDLALAVNIVFQYKYSTLLGVGLPRWKVRYRFPPSRAKTIPNPSRRYRLSFVCGSSTPPHNLFALVIFLCFLFVSSRCVERCADTQRLRRKSPPIRSSQCSFCREW